MILKRSKEIITRVEEKSRTWSMKTEVRETSAAGLRHICTFPALALNGSVRVGELQNLHKPQFSHL